MLSTAVAETLTQSGNTTVSKFKYSKSSAFYRSTKRSFFEDNEVHLQNAKRINSLYLSQPARTSCKLCDAKISSDADFASHGVGYVFCSTCGHLNGLHQDTLAFVDKLYVSQDGTSYSTNYVDSGYFSRMRDVYLPKFDFLIESLPPDPRRTFLDLGCGAGYFVAAGLARNANISGFDVSKTMVDFGNVQIKNLYGQEPLIVTAENDLLPKVAASEHNVMSAIGVIEHMSDPRQFFTAFQKSKAEYLYYSVPMFSLSSIIENAFPDVYPRQLSGAHTHLFTERSIERMTELLGCKVVGQWRFGTDAMDLLRSLRFKTTANGASRHFETVIEDNLGPIADKLQAVMDEAHFCSEIHCVLQKA